MTRHLKFYLGLLSMFPLKQQKSNFYFNQKNRITNIVKKVTLITSQIIYFLKYLFKDYPRKLIRVYIAQSIFNKFS